MKKALKFAFLICLAAVTLTACGGGGGSSSGTTTTTDTTPPTVSSTIPANNATDVATNTAISATFSEAMDSTTITTSAFTVSGGVTGTVSYTGTTATWTPSANLSYNTTHTATITTGARDLAGNAMATTYSWSFTTGPAPGSLDTTFDSDGKVTTAIGSGNDLALAIAIQSDGKIVAGGYSSNGTDDDFAIARYNTDGSLDTTFDSDGKVTTAIGSGNDYAYAIAIQSDGKIVAGGSSNNGTDDDFAIVRYWQ